MKRVLHIITRLDPGGSAENTVLSAELVNPDVYDSYVISGMGLGGDGPPEMYIKRLQDRLILDKYLVRPVNPKNDVLAIFSLAGKIRKIKPDIIHVHTAKAGAIGRVAVKLSGSKAKLIYTPHGHVFSGYGSQAISTVFTIIEKRLAPVTDTIVALTRDEIVEFRNNNAGKEEQYCIIPSGVDLSGSEEQKERKSEVRENLGINNEKVVVGFVGRFEEVKGSDIFVEAINRINRKLPDIHYLMIGDGSQKKLIDKKVQEYGLEDKITFTGWRRDARDLYPAIDILLLTSRNEGQGRVLVEAMAKGIPCVAMISGGVAEVIKNNESGILVKFEDYDNVINAVEKLVNDEAFRLKIINNAVDRAHSHFSLEVMINRLDKLYTGLLEKKTAKEIFGNIE